MAGRRGPGDRDPDDWFAGGGGAPEFTEVVATRPRGRQSELAHVTEDPPDAAADDWIRYDETRSIRATRRDPWGRLDPRTRLLLAIAVVAVLVLIGLVVGGAFSSSHHPTAPITTTEQTTESTETTTTPAATSALPAPTTPLTVGDHGTQVRVLQRALKSLGDDPGVIDGSYGPKTKAAVTTFQTASKLKPDGIAGPLTLRALKAALTRP